MYWMQTQRADKAAAKIADRHYSRQKPGTNQFTPPGRVIVLVTPQYDALWATSWPYAEYVNRVMPDAWVNSIFRNESGRLSSEMILQAVACTKWYFGNPPQSGMITLIDTTKVKPIKKRSKEHWGYTYEKAGFEQVDKTQGGLLIFQLLPNKMPKAAPPLNYQMNFLEPVRYLIGA